MKIRNIHPKWFTWNFLPKEPLNIQSIIEIIVFIAIFAFCLYLFINWNDVPVKRISIYSGVYRDSNIVERIEINIPMTSCKDISSGLPNLHISRIGYGSHRVKQAEREENRERYGEYFHYDKDKSQPVFSHAYVSFFKKWNVNYSKAFAYDSIVFSSTKFSNFNHECYRKIEAYNRQFEKGIIDTKMGFTDDGIYNVKMVYDKIVSISTNDVTIETKGIESDLAKVKNSFQYFFNPNSPMERPLWTSLEDISQSYYKIDIHLYNVDSLTLKIDFLGVTDFSKMDPSPDRIDMSSISFTDPYKIARIRNKGLFFHARYKDLENRQQIRLFGVTAIMSGFITIFVIFLIYGCVKIFRILRQNSPSFAAKQMTFMD